MNGDQSVTEGLVALKIRSGMSLADIAEEMGYGRKPSSIQRYFTPGARKREDINFKMLGRLVKAFTGKGNPPIAEHEVLAVGRRAMLQLDDIPDKDTKKYAGDGRRVEAPAPLDDEDMLSVVGLGRCGDEETFVVTDHEIDKVHRPPELKNVKGAYCLEIVGESMRPMFKPGQRVYVHPNRFPRAEYGVVIYKVGGGVIIKEYVRDNGNAFRVKEYYPQERSFDVPKSEIERLHLILMMAEH